MIQDVLGVRRGIDVSQKLLTSFCGLASERWVLLFEALSILSGSVWDPEETLFRKEGQHVDMN